jgi:ATP-dependent Clp protease ATP-binding subunit ClpA
VSAGRVLSQDQAIRAVDFRNTIIIMTSNLGSQVIKELNRDYAAMEREVRKILAGDYREGHTVAVDVDGKDGLVFGKRQDNPREDGI